MTSTTATPSTTPAVGGVQTVRRVITYLLLATTVIITASGLSGLLERLLTVNRVEVSFDNYGLATSLASALIAGPLAGLLWWLTWRDSAMARDRASVIWPVYLMLMSTVALLVFTISILSWVADAITSGWDPYGLWVSCGHWCGCGMTGCGGIPVRDQRGCRVPPPRSPPSSA